MKSNRNTVTTNDLISASRSASTVGDKPSPNMQLVLDYMNAYTAADSAAMEPLLTDDFIAQNVSTDQSTGKSEWVQFIKFNKYTRDAARVKVGAPAVRPCVRHAAPSRVCSLAVSQSADYMGVNGISEQQGVVTLSVWEIQDTLVLYVLVLSIAEGPQPKISKLWLYKTDDRA
ncbi:hypothetical protein EVG20_g8511 [Dentipellis fragilis]|uniref:SnoaL-like domain-containing protein n=1 Tax=Dentipellis fragilis TaxID=205917 RepID=A0A4Y9Y4Z3_9AGAM|nr:hypothetical protein EVG20_g8511 [Dentipellis fragilis]